MNSERTISRRSVDREEGRLITRQSEKTLKARGYTAQKLMQDDGSLRDSDLVMGLAQKKDDFELTSHGPTAKGPQEPLHNFVTTARRAGYDVRLAKQQGIDYFRPYVRFDLDKFIARVPENLLTDQDYSLLAKPFLFHAWGDNLEDCTAEQREQYEAENEKIIRFIKEKEKQNFHVRLIEREYEGGTILIPYTRPKKYEVPRPLFETESPLTGITEEKPKSLLARGFKILETVRNDDSLAVIPEKTPPLALDNAYLATIEYVQKFGTVPSKDTPPPSTVRERIIQAASKGYEIRAYQANYNPDTGAFTRDSSFLTLFQRFDFAQFVESTNTDIAELLKRGFSFDVNMQLSTWGDGPKARGATRTEQTKNEQRTIEEYVQKKEARGNMVRFVVGKYDFTTKKLENSAVHVAAFIKQKR